MNRAFLAIATAALLLASPASGQVVVDGDLADLIAVAQGSQADPINEIIPTCKSGFDLANVHVYYDVAADELYIGLDIMDVPPGVGVAGPGVPGDADGDNNPSLAGNPACPEVEDDQFGVGPDETYLVRIDTDNDGSFDTAVDLRIEYRNNALTLRRGNGTAVPGTLSASIMLGVSGASADPGMPNQNLATSDIEIVVRNYGDLDVVPLCFRLTTFSGSLVDIPPEDVLNQPITVNISDPAVDVTLEARNVTQAGAFTTSDIAVAPGDIVEFRMTIDNIGNAPLDPAQLRNTLPAELTFDAGSVVGTVNFTQSGQLITFRELGGDKNLPAGVVRQVTFQATVGAITTLVLDEVTGGGPGPIECGGDIAQDDDTIGLSGIAIECDKEVSLDGISYSATVTASPGQRVFFRVTVTNPSGIPLDNVIVSDVLPAGFTDPQTAAPDCSFTGNSLTCNILQIPASGQVVIDYDAEVSATSGPLVNTVVVQGDGGGTTASDVCQATVQIAGPCIDCVQEVSLDGVNFFPSVTADIGQDVTFRITAQNCGDAALFTATLIATLPAGYSNLISLDGRCNAAGLVLTCAEIGPLAPAGSTQVLFQATVTATSGTLQSTVDVVGIPGSAGNPGDPVLSQCLATVTVRPCGLVCTKEVSLDGIAFGPSVDAEDGDTVFYRVTITNTAPAGGCTFPQIDLVDVLPSELTFLAFTSPPAGGDSCGHDVPSNTITCAFLSVAPGASRSFEYSAQIDTGGMSATLVNMVSASGTTGSGGNPGQTFESSCQATVDVEIDRPIPTLSEWALIALVGLLGLLLVSRQRNLIYGLPL